jgi:acetylornithine aminotransferase
MVGEHLMKRLRKMANDGSKAGSHITDVRGRGLMIGIDLDIPHKEVRQRLVHEEHCFTGCAGTNVLRLLPPLCLTIDEADQFIEKLTKALV